MTLYTLPEDGAIKGLQKPDCQPPYDKFVSKIDTTLQSVITGYLRLFY